MIKYLAPAIALTFTANISMADEYRPALENYLATSIITWADDAMIIDAIRAANMATGDYNEAQIYEMDQAWRAEVSMDSRPTISTVLNNPASSFLRDIVEASNGAITEVFIMDSVGLNVAASDVTSDMWQGDEDKFILTYGEGHDAVHIAEVEFDDSTQTYQGQISITISDPATSIPMGAITVGVNASSLF